MPFDLPSFQAVFCDWHWNFRNFKQVAEDDVYLSGAAVPHVNVTALKSCLTQEDNGWPFYVVNLIKLNDFAVYNGKVDYSLTGREANNIYGVTVIKELLKRGSYPLYTGKSLGTVISGMGHSQPSSSSSLYYDTVAVVRYRSRVDFFAIFVDTEAEASLKHKFAGIFDTVVVCSSPGIMLSDILISLLLLLAMALL